MLAKGDHANRFTIGQFVLACIENLMKKKTLKNQNFISDPNKFSVFFIVQINEYPMKIL